MDTIDDVLEHFGIRGMKWGVRRERGSDGTVGGAHGHSTSSDAEKAKEYATRAKTSGTHTLSNQELEHLTKRLNLEQQYSRLSSSGGDRKTAGANFAKDILKQVGRQQAVNLANKAVTTALENALKK